jgi:hypothetical protein
LIAVPLVAAPAAVVRVQDGPAPVAVAPGRAAAERYVRSRFHVRQVDSSGWKPGLVLNWVVGFGGRSERRIAFFGGGRYLGSDADFGGIGQVGQLGTRGRRAASFALTVYRLQDRPCCPTGRTIEVRFSLAGGRLRFIRPLLRPGIEVAEGLQMPSRNIGCIFSNPSFVRCDVRTGLRPRPPRPAGCGLDWGYGLEMTAASQPETFCAGDTALGTGPILAYGATVRLLGFTCRSQRSGLRCTNRAGHGFFLARERWRRF